MMTLQNKIRCRNSRIRTKNNHLSTICQTSLQNKEIELLRPIEEKTQNAINIVVEKGKYTYILDSSSGIFTQKKVKIF